MSALADATLRGSVLLLIGLLVSALPGRRSAATRHGVLLASLFGAAALWPLVLLLPAWTPGVTAHADAVSGGMPTAVAVATAGLVERASGPSVDVVRVATVIWLAGAATILSTLFAGLARLHAVAAGAEPIGTGRWVRIGREVSDQYGLARRVTILRTDAPGLLATWGLLRPKVLVPAHAFAWSDERVRVVLRHELAHERRHDWFVQTAADVLRAVYWYNPLFWVACARLRRESERASDDAVLRAGSSPRDYAGHLIDLARACRGVPARIAAVPMARPSALQGRITAMLNPDLDRDGLSCRTIAGTGAALLALLLPLALVRAEPPQPQTLSGVIYDASGAAMPQVALTLEDEQHQKRQATTDDAGHFEFTAVPAGSYVMGATRAGFRALRYELTLGRASDWTQAITLQLGEVNEEINVSAPRGAVPATPAAGAARRVKVGGDVQPPKKVKDVRPVYPQSMRDAGLEGVVPMEAVIARDGTVTSVRVVSATVHPDLAAAAVAAVREWRFEPTRLNGVAVEVAMKVVVNFSLSE